jgi:hypothetical protein
MESTRSFLALAGLIQIVAIVLGFAALGIVMKFNGYPQEDFFRWTPLARGLRENGLYLFLVPVLWSVAVVIAAQIDRRWFPVDLVVCTGFILAIGLLALFLCAAFSPYTRPLVFH